MAKWKKIGNFSEFKGPAIYTPWIIHNVTYQTSIYNNLTGGNYYFSLALYKYDDGNFKIAVFDPERRLVGIPGFRRQSSNPKDQYTCSVPTSDKETLRTLLNRFNEVESIEEIKEELLITLGIKKSSDEIHQQILELAKGENLQEAIKFAKQAHNEGYDGALWILAEFIKDSEPDEAYELYLSIPKENIKSQEAAERIIHLTYEILDAVNKGIAELDENEILEYKENILKYGLRSSSPSTSVQNIIDQTYHELCGGTGLTPDIRNVKGDPETLLASAKLMRGLRLQLKDMKKPDPSSFFSSNSEGKFKSPKPGRRQNL